MIEEPPLLTIRARDRRPKPAQVAALAAHPTGVLADAMGGRGGLPAGVAPVAPGELTERCAGPALTVEAGPSGILALLAALTEIEAGDVVMVATGGWRASAAFGDRVCGMARNAGAAGIVADGPARDRAGIVAAGLPAFADGLCPNSPYANGPGKVGLPVALSGVRVETGDVVVCDRDGVVVVPFAELDAVAEAAQATAKLEIELDAEVAAGRTAPEAIRELVASDRVKRV